MLTFSGRPARRYSQRVERLAARRVGRVALVVMVLGDALRGVLRGVLGGVLGGQGRRGRARSRGPFLREQHHRVVGAAQAARSSRRAPKK